MQIKIQKISLPAGVSGAEYARVLKRAVSTGELPEGWEVDIAWRNPKTQKGRSREWQSGEFTEVIAASRSGFGTVVKRVIQDYASTLPGSKRKPGTKAEREKRKRAAASKRGWVTRRANLKAKRAAYAKRSEPTRVKSQRTVEQAAKAAKAKGRKKR